ncbi:hypothetical protein LCGC14_1509590 [marine sediment metagenome]|uniref:HNH nuclease domain-containing protein n=1 Tax=marine sediment metagenome TaxID=412755 RepID=A0A0F9J1U1_9ZZZZ
MPDDGNMERWAPLPGHGNLYSVSSIGNVVRHEQVIAQISRGGKRYTRRINFRLLKPYTRHGYLMTNLGAGGKSWTRPIHQLVLFAFVGPREEGMVCRHLNGIKTDNRLANLCWGTHKENSEDAVRHGHTHHPVMIGTNNTRAKITDDDVRVIRRRIRHGERHADIASDYDLTRAAVSHIGRRFTWAHVKD